MEHYRSELKSTHERKRLRKKRLGWKLLLRPSVWKSAVAVGFYTYRVLKFLWELLSPKE